VDERDTSKKKRVILARPKNPQKLKQKKKVGANQKKIRNASTGKTQEKKETRGGKKMGF